MTARNGDSEELLELLRKWGDVIEQLLTGESSQQELNAYLDLSRRTIGRALSEFEEMGVVTHEKNNYWLTHYGRQVAWARCEYTSRIEAVEEAAPLLKRLPGNIPLGCEILDDAEIVVEPEAAPESAWVPVDRAVAEGDEVKGIAPKVTRSYIDTFYGEIVEENTAVELILPQSVFTAIVANYDREWQAAITTENCWFGAFNGVPPFGMLIIDDSEVWIGVYRDSGSALAGTLHNDSEAAVEWALDLYERCRRKSEKVAV